MSASYKLYRKSGYLFFNTLGEEEIYWVSILAAAQCGGPMYARISREEFDMVFEEQLPVENFKKYFNRDWNRASEMQIEENYGVNEALSVHQLENYAPMKTPDGKYSPGINPVKSVILVSETNDGKNQNSR